MSEHVHEHTHAPLVELGEVGVEETKPWQRVVTVSVPVSEWLNAREKATRDLRKGVTLPGFRKGKAPVQIVLKPGDIVYVGARGKKFTWRDIGEILWTVGAVKTLVD